MDIEYIRTLPIILSNHAKDRIKERFGIGKKASKSLVTKAVLEGDIQKQKYCIDGELSISVLHKERLFKLVVKEDYLLCSTAHPLFWTNEPHVTRVRGKLVEVKKKMHLKQATPKKKDVHKRKRRIGI